MGPAFTVFKVPFWNIRKRMRGRRVSHFGGKGRLFLLMFGYEKWNSKASTCLQNLRFSSTKFSFQSSDRCFKMRKGVCCIVLRGTGIQILTSIQVPHIRFLFCSLSIATCFSVGRALDHSPLRLPNTRTKLWSKKCVFWYMELSLTVASLLAEEAHNNLGIFCLFFLLLN